MSTPKKNNKTFNYTSPYSKPPAQYPSQNEDYISLDMGGRSEPDLKPGRDLFGNNNHYKNNQRRGNHQNYFGNAAYSNNYSNNRCMTPRKNNDDTYRYTNNRKSENASISAYVHPSMTEDPWIGLMTRIESIEKSSISLRSEDRICHSTESLEAANDYHTVLNVNN